MTDVARPVLGDASGLPAWLQEFGADVSRGMAGSPKHLPSKYFYDALGSCLFEAICRLPWYRITRVERRLLERHAPAIGSALDDPVTITELGCGSGEKLAILAGALGRAGRGARVHLVDVSPMALELSERTLGRLAHVSVYGHQSSYEVGLQRVAAEREPRGSMLVLFLGSNIGNFDPPAAHEFLQRIRAILRPGDALLLGADLVKPEGALVAAYDDPLGLTAAFNKNVLLRINRELGGEFDLAAFDHRAVWNVEASRVEMHLVSRRAHEVRIPGAGCVARFEAGESIWTESSYKYQPDTIEAMGREAGFRCREQWIDPDAGFALALFNISRQ